MNIAHVSKHHCSGAPGTLSGSLNMYKGVRSHAFYLYDLNDSNVTFFDYWLKRCDIIHWHNHVSPEIYNRHKNKKHVIQYHSEPEIVECAQSSVDISKFTKLVVAHYHTCLNFYSQMIPVRNVVNVFSPWESRVSDDTYKICYTPSTSVGGVWQDKAISKHKLVLKRVKEHFKDKGINVKYNVITNRSLEDVMKCKASSDIVLDECITPSYHLSGLEGLACGKTTVCWLDELVAEQLKKISKSSRNPFIGCYIGYLEDFLINLINKGHKNLNKQSLKSYNWFLRYWRTETIVKEYIDIYESIV